MAPGLQGNARLVCTEGEVEDRGVLFRYPVGAEKGDGQSILPLVVGYGGSGSKAQLKSCTRASRRSSWKRKDTRSRRIISSSLCQSADQCLGRDEKMFKLIQLLQFFRFFTVSGAHASRVGREGGGW